MEKTNKKPYVIPKMMICTITKDNIYLAEELYKMGDISREVINRIRQNVYGNRTNVYILQL